MHTKKSVRTAELFIASVLLLATGAGCSYRPSVYAPNAFVISMFDSAGQASLGGVIGTSSYGAQVAWSPLQHLYVHASISGFGSQIDSASEHAWHSYIEAGIGGYLVGDEQFHLDAGFAYGRGRAIGNGRDVCSFCNFPAPGGYEAHTRESGDYGRASGQLLVETTVIQSANRQFGLHNINGVRVSRVTFDELTDETTSFYPDTTITSRAVRTGVARTFVEFSFGGRLWIRPISIDLLMMFAKGIDTPSFDAVSMQLTAGMSVRIDYLLELF